MNLPETHRPFSRDSNTRRARHTSWLVVLLVALCPPCCEEVALAIDVAVPELPPLLSETGLYVLSSTTDVDPANLAFSPQYPLWSDGAVKSRWIYLPPGTSVDARDPDFWRFPVGTKLWKEFAFNGRRTETRLLWLGPDSQWSFASYCWREDGSDAGLAPSAGLFEWAPIVERKFHSIPGVGECQACHLAGGNGVLGFNALQLSPDRDPLAPHGEPLAEHMLTLDTLVARGHLTGLAPELLANPPRIATSNSRARAALGYLFANCGGCHNSSGPLAHLGLDLRRVGNVAGTSFGATDGAAGIAEDALWASLVAVADYSIPNLAAESTRWITPGSPDQSSIIFRMSSRRPSSQMPPLGTTLVDHDAVELIRHWVSEDLRAKSLSRGNRNEPER